MRDVSSIPTIRCSCGGVPSSNLKRATASVTKEPTSPVTTWLLDAIFGSSYPHRGQFYTLYLDFDAASVCACHDSLGVEEFSHLVSRPERFQALCLPFGRTVFHGRRFPFVLPGPARQLCGRSLCLYLGSPYFHVGWGFQ